jgi:hypothetical protein
MTLKDWLFGNLLVVAVAILVFSGCNRRVQGPELEYSQPDVELIKRQIEATDW